MMFEKTDKSEISEDAVEEKIAEIERTLDATRDQLLRRTAELENMRRRHQQEREQLIFDANKRLLIDLLGTIDDLERTIEHASESDDRSSSMMQGSSIMQGVELIYKNFLKTLERYGVHPMQTVGEPFDPMKHDALLEEPRDDVAAGLVTREIQRGYMLHDTILRHAKVFVSKAAE
jgi:molecular chaperone GrpE